MKRLIYAADGLSSRERVKIAKQTTNPRELLRLAYDKSRLVREAVAQNEAITEQIAEVLLDEGVEGFNDKAKIALIKKFPDIFCSMLADDKSVYVRLSAVRNTTDPKLLEKFVNDEDWYIRKRVAYQTDDDNILSKLADDADRQVRYAVSTRTTNLKILEKLANDNDQDIRRTVARSIIRITDNLAVLLKLADNEDPIVRRIVAERTANPTILEKLANDEDPDVRISVAYYTDDDKILRKLLTDEDPSVVSSALAHIDDPAVPAQFADNPNWVIRRAVAEKTSDLSILRKLATDKDPHVKHAVVDHTDDPDILAILANDANEYIRMDVALKINDPTVLKMLLKDEDKEVRDIARERIERLGISLEPRTKRVRKPTQTEWSIPLFELENYSSIESEIDAVLADAINAAMKQAFLNAKFSYDITADSYDDDGELIITAYFEDGTDEDFRFDLQRILAIATSSQRKKECIKKTASFLVKNM